MNPLDADRGSQRYGRYPQSTEYVRGLSVLVHIFHRTGITAWCSLPAPTSKIYELGIESIPSESECYPAKLAHGHVTWLIRQGIKFIFYPVLFLMSAMSSEDANNHYNCPIVTSYAENIKNNVEEIAGGEMSTSAIRSCPSQRGNLANGSTDALTKEFIEIPAAEIARSLRKAAWQELANARRRYGRKRAKKRWNS